MSYEIIILDVATGTQVIKKTDLSGVWFIPFADANADYQEYLEWVDEGNEPEVIDG